VVSLPLQSLLLRVAELLLALTDACSVLLLAEVMVMVVVVLLLLQALLLLLLLTLLPFLQLLLH